MELHDGDMIAECCLSDVVALFALGFGACFLITIVYISLTKQNTSESLGIQRDPMHCAYIKGREQLIDR
jgi:hypothetical protein